MRPFGEIVLLLIQSLLKSVISSTLTREKGLISEIRGCCCWCWDSIPKMKPPLGYQSGAGKLKNTFYGSYSKETRQETTRGSVTEGYKPTETRGLAHLWAHSCSTNLCSKRRGVSALRSFWKDQSFWKAKTSFWGILFMLVTVSICAHINRDITIVLY